ncbi:porin [Paracoccus seriniphilus]|uniref:Outer membrane protein OmpU n=1 Tax=Paracoccus seriniphilus TaxID=184748 RepID=A0A239Q176_9RHOB|nr:porin [Paracoccus seriniphilus]WCR13946.1 porin [Paracoccus seriniphilus]SNT75962.1 outer membrane protein OmpU [Paracoccus seriniphilus]
MKKVLFATTALVVSGGIAAADVTISGYGRFGVDYQEDRGFNDAGDELSDAKIETRLRMNIDASTSTDQGVDFGGRVRLQYNDGDSETNVSAAYLYVSANGLTVSVGNVNTAFDSAGLIYESEVGLISRSYGNAQGDFYAFDSDAYDNNNRMGVAVEYEIAGASIMASYIDPDQTTDGQSEEFSIKADYTWNNIALSAAYVQNAAGTEDADKYFIGAYYTMAGTNNGIGLNYIDEDSDADNQGQTIVLYGDYEVAPMTTLSAYIANNDRDSNETDNAFGIGAKYDLGGAYLAGSIERGYDENVRADMGVRFDF